jgi:hypothetical protein
MGLVVVVVVPHVAGLKAAAGVVRVDDAQRDAHQKTVATWFTATATPNDAAVNVPDVIARR